MYLLTTIDLIGGQSTILFTWVVIIKLVNTIWCVATTLVVTLGNALLPLNFLPTETPPNPLPNFATNLINIPLLIQPWWGAIIVSTPIVVIPTSKWLSNYYSNRFFPGFNNCCFWHDWWSCVDSMAAMFHSMVSHWSPLLCRMWM